MNRIRSLAVTAALMGALAAVAQQTTASTADQAKAASADSNGVPGVQSQMTVLTEKLALTTEQQTQMTTILQELHDATVKIVEDASLSHDEQLAKVRPYRYKARDEMREILSDDQKKKLDEYLEGPHPEMHGKLTGSGPSHP